MHDTTRITTVDLAENGEHVLVLDSTRRLIESCAAAASAQVPGSYRGAWTGRRVTGSIKPTGQDITVVLEIMTNSAGTTAAAFEADTSSMSGASSLTVTDGATKLINWLPMTSDFRIRYTTTGASLTDVDVDFLITPRRTSGA